MVSEIVSSSEVMATQGTDEGFLLSITSVLINAIISVSGNCLTARTNYELRSILAEIYLKNSVL